MQRFMFRRYLSIPSKEYADSIMKRSTSAEISLIRKTLNLIITAAPEARKLVIGRVSPQLAKSVDWFGRWIIGTLSGKSSILIRAPVQQLNDVKGINLQQALYKSRAHTMDIVYSSSYISNVHEIVKGIQSMETSNIQTSTTSTGSTLTGSTLEINEEKSGVDENEEMLKRAIASLFLTQMPPSSVNILIEKLHKYCENNITIDELMTELLDICDIHRYLLKVMYPYLNIPSTSKIRNKLKQSKTSYNRLQEDLQESLHVFATKVPIWKEEDEVFLRQISSYFDSNSNESKILAMNIQSPKNALNNVNNSTYLFFPTRCYRLLNPNMHHDDQEEGYDTFPSKVDDGTLSECDPSLKFLVKNIPRDTTASELRQAFRNCGIVTKVWITKDDRPEPKVAPPPSQVDVEMNETEESSDEHVEEVDETDSGKRKKRRPKSRRVLVTSIKKLERSDAYAFARMAEAEGYERATSQDMRVLGVCIKQRVYRVEKASAMQTLIVTMWDLKSTKDSVSMLQNVLQDSFEIDTTYAYDRRTPHYVYLEFGCHADAWKAYEILQSYPDRSGKFSVDWLRTATYFETKRKIKELSLATPSEASPIVEAS